MSVDIRDILRDLPEKSGVYLMKDAVGDVIYVGKAKVLKNRVKSYFNGSHSGKVAAMVSHVVSIDWVVTQSENEAFALEINLIKQFKPKYNIMLRDDKHYPYIKVDVKSDYPKITVVRKVKRDGAKYYGPYFSTTSMRKMLDTLRKVFPVRTCNKNITKIKGKERPCLNYHIGRCIAPCLASVSKEEYNKVIHNAVQFLEGHDESIEQELTQLMNEASAKMDFEGAVMYRDSIDAIRQAMSQQQRAIHGHLESYDIIGVAGQDIRAVACVMVVRNGKITGSENFRMDMPEGGELEEILAHFIKNYYSNANMVPLNIITSHPLDDAGSIEEYLIDMREGPVHIKQISRGEKKQLVDMAIDNAQEDLKRAAEHDKRQWDRTGGAVDDLQWYLALPTRPRRIEAYDISNIQGVESVASMVVFIDGVAERKSYRRFKIKTVEGANDFASMAEVVHRRFKRGLDERANPDANAKFSDFPDLVLIDGGKGQLGAARKSMEDLGVGYISTIGLAKREEEVFVPNESEPIIIQRGTPALHLLQRLRDEAHRFAITYHRSLRRKGNLRSELDGIPAIGPARRKALLLNFPTISAIKNATVDELAAVRGMTLPSAQAVYDHYHPTEGDSTAKSE